MVAVVLVAAVGVSVLAYESPVAPPVSQVPATLVVRGYVGEFSPQFYAVAAHTAQPSGLAHDPGVQTLLNASPIRFLRYGAGSDSCDPIHNISYSPNGTPRSGCDYDLSSLKAWCTSLHPTCETLYQLPGETNNSSEDAAIVAWLLGTVGFEPTYFAIGNEPSGWTHFGIPWTSWRSTDNSVPTPLAYAVEVRSVIAAVRAVDPSAQFVGIEAASPYGLEWFTTLVHVDGPQLSAVAYHLYPGRPLGAEPTVDQLYGLLDGIDNISSTYGTVRGAVDAACGCTHLPVQIGEYNAGPVPSVTGVYPPLDGQYPDAVFLAGSIDQALAEGVPALTFFSLQSPSTAFEFGMLNSADAIAPVGLLYEEILPSFAGRWIDALAIAGAPDVWGTALVTNATGGQQVSALLVNAQVATQVRLRIGALLPPGTNATLIGWQPGEPQPGVEHGVRLGENVTLPPQGLLLINATVPSGVPAVGRLGPARSPAPELRGIAGAAPFTGGLPLGTGYATRSPEEPAGAGRCSFRSSGGPTRRSRITTGSSRGSGSKECGVPRGTK